MFDNYLKYAILIISLWIIPFETTQADSISLSPLGLTFHGKSQSELAPLAPRKLDKNADWTWHPEVNLTYKSKHMQYSVFFMKDTINDPSGGFFLGPKIDFLSVFSVGVVGGTLVRPERHFPLFSIKKAGIQVIPMGGATFSIKIPLDKRVFLENNYLLNGYVNHGTIGLGVNF